MTRGRDQKPSSISRLLSERERRSRGAGNPEQSQSDGAGIADAGATIGGSGGGLFQGLTEIVEKVVELAENGEQEFADEVTREFVTKNETVGNAAFGYRIRVGLGGSESDQTEEAPIAEPKEPLIDVHDEASEIAVTAQFPGLRSEDLIVEVHGRMLQIKTLCAQRFTKTVTLPARPDPESLQVRCENGILDIRMKKLQASS